MSVLLGIRVQAACLTNERRHASCKLRSSCSTSDIRYICISPHSAEMERKHLRLPFLKLNIVANDGDGFRQEIKLDGGVYIPFLPSNGELRHLLLPAAGELLESCVRTNYFPERNMARPCHDSKHVFPGRRVRGTEDRLLRIDDRNRPVSEQTVWNPESISSRLWSVQSSWM